MNKTIVVDENIIAGESCFAQFGRVRTVAGRQLSREQLLDADALIVRSVTKVNAELLAGTPVRFVGSTTIGTDHIDAAWLQQAGIRWTNAPGCNAQSVVDYCLSAYAAIDGLWERLLAGARVGIIGYGNVGSRLHRRLQALGIQCLAYDPFLDERQCPIRADLDAVLACEVLSLHAPLTTAGPHPTRHLLSFEQLAALPPQALLLNAGRGEVLDTGVLKRLAEQRPDIELVLDVWEGEPNIDLELMANCRIATPHIAGYSADGKITGLQMVAEAYADFIGQPLAGFALPPQLQQPPQLQLPQSAAQAGTVEETARLIRELIWQCYDVREDDRRLRTAIAQGGEKGLAVGEVFDAQRKHYPLRRELARCQLQPGDGLGAGAAETLRALGIDPRSPEL